MMKKAIIDYLVIGVIVRLIQGAIGEEFKKYVLTPVLKKLQGLFIKWFIKTEKDWLLYLHSINKKMDKGSKD